MKSLQHQIAAYSSWGRTPNRSARTANGRTAFENKFLAEADGDPKRAEALRKAYFLELARKSAQSRGRRKEVRQAAIRRALAELDANGGAGDAT